MGRIVRAIGEMGGVVITAIEGTDIVNEIEQIHKTSAVVTAALGRLTMAASMMGCALKGKDESVTVRVKGDGPIGTLIAVSDADGWVRCYAANAVVELPLNAYGKLDVGGAVGKNGTLSVIKDVGEGEPFSGTVELVSGEIAEDITAYYAYSEQVPSSCALGVLVNPDLSVRAAGGFLVQLLPGTTEEEITQLEENLKDLPAVTQMLSDGLSLEDIIDKVMVGFNHNLLDEFTVGYRCGCSKERVKKMLISLGHKDLQDMIDEGEPVEVGCHFCNQKYLFDAGELEKLKSCIDSE